MTRHANGLPTPASTTASTTSTSSPLVLSPYHSPSSRLAARTPPTSGMPIRQRATSRATPSRATSPHPNNSRPITLATTITPTMARWQAPRSSNSRIVPLPLDATRLTSPSILPGVPARSTSWQVCPTSMAQSTLASSPTCRRMVPLPKKPTIVRSLLRLRSFHH